MTDTNTGTISQRIMRALRDNAWQFGGVVIGVVTLAIMLWQIFGPKYRLEAVILSASSLDELAAGFSDELDVRYQGQPVENLAWIDVKIENTGNQEIASHNYEGPLDFRFAEGTRLLDASVIETVPDDLELTISIDSEAPNIAHLAPVMFKAEERGLIRFISVDIPNVSARQLLDIDARISRITSVPVTSAIEQSTAAPNTLGIAGAMCGIVLLIALMVLAIVRAISRE